MGEIRQKYPAILSQVQNGVGCGQSLGWPVIGVIRTIINYKYRSAGIINPVCRSHHEHYRIARYVTALEHEACRYTSVIWTWENGPKVSREVVKMIQYFTGKLLAGHSVRQYFTCLILTAHLGVSS